MTVWEKIEQTRENRATRSAALVADPGYLASVIAQTRFRDAELRALAAQHLASLGKSAATPEAIEALKALLSDPEDTVRLAAITALGEFGRTTVAHRGLLSVLALQLRRDEPDIVYAALHALRNIPWTLAKGEDFTQVRDALVSLESRGDAPERALPLLQDALLPYRLEQKRTVSTPIPDPIAWFGNLMRHIKNQPHRGRGAGNEDPLRRPDDRGASQIAEGEFEETGIRWYKLRKEQRTYLVFVSDQSAHRDTAWRVLLNDGSHSFMLLSKPMAESEDSLGYLELSPATLEPEEIVPLEALFEEDGTSLETALTPLDGWDNRGLREWGVWIERHPR